MRRVSFNSFFPPVQSVQLAVHTLLKRAAAEYCKLDVGLQLLLEGGENGETTAVLYVSHRMFRFVYHNVSAASSFLVALQPPHGSR